MNHEAQHPPEMKYPKTIFSREFIQKHGVIEDVLGGFLEAQMKDIQKVFKYKYPKVPKSALPKLLSRFVTLEGTKRPMAISEIRQSELSSEQLDFSLEKLETARILRQEDGMYELAHDTLALYIAEQRGTEEIAFLEVVKMIKDRHHVYPQTQTLLNANELQLAAFNQKSLEKEAVLTTEEWNYISKSKKGENQRLRLRQLLILGLIGILSSFSIFSYFQSNKAQQKEREATEAREAAEGNLQQLKIEQAQKTEAKYKEHLALGQSLMAQNKYLEAIKEFETALAFNEKGKEALGFKKEASSKAGVSKRFESLMKDGESLEASGLSTLVDARSKYQQALALGFNNGLVQAKLEGIKGKLENAYDKFLKDGDTFFDAEGYEFALKNYQQALRINPGESELRQKVAACKQKLGL